MENILSRAEILESLERDSVVVIRRVLTDTECDSFIRQYKDWYSNFTGDRRRYLRQRQSVIQNFWVGHIEPSWKIRLLVKPVFERIWDTEKLLTSVDGVAISSPPEQEGEGFNMKNPEYRSNTDAWLHLDQGGRRKGRHAIQGAVYLEESKCTDYCFRIMRGSERYHEEFFQTFRPNEKLSTTFFKLKPKEIAWFESKGCETVFVEVPKGSIILWDSRTVHDNLPPERGRPDCDRWRHVTFVTMTPAIWASEDDLKLKRSLYNKKLMSSHWSSQGIKILGNYTGRKRKYNGEVQASFMELKSLPALATSAQVKRLLGVKSYDFDDGKSNGPPKPVWC